MARGKRNRKGGHTEKQNRKNNDQASETYGLQQQQALLFMQAAMMGWGMPMHFAPFMQFPPPQFPSQQHFNGHQPIQHPSYHDFPPHLWFSHLERYGREAVHSLLLQRMLQASTQINRFEASGPQSSPESRTSKAPKKPKKTKEAPPSATSSSGGDERNNDDDDENIPKPRNATPSTPSMTATTNPVSHPAPKSYAQAVNSQPRELNPPYRIKPARTPRPVEVDEDEINGLRVLRDYHGRDVVLGKDFRRRGKTERAMAKRAAGY